MCVKPGYSHCFSCLKCTNIDSKHCDQCQTCVALDQQHCEQCNTCHGITTICKVDYKKYEKECDFCHKFFFPMIYKCCQICYKNIKQSCNDCYNSLKNNFNAGPKESICRECHGQEKSEYCQTCNIYFKKDMYKYCHECRQCVHKNFIQCIDCGQCHQDYSLNDKFCITCQKCSPSYIEHCEKCGKCHQKGRRIVYCKVCQKCITYFPQTPFCKSCCVGVDMPLAPVVSVQIATPMSGIQLEKPII